MSIIDPELSAHLDPIGLVFIRFAIAYVNPAVAAAVALLVPDVETG